MSMRRSLSALVRPSAFAGALLCLACIGGTGTDTDNGIADRGPLDGTFGTAARVVDPDGNPLPGVEVLLHTPTFRADSGPALDLILDSAKSLISDSLGYVRFHLAQPGRYVVEGRKGGASLFFDTLAVADVKALSAYTFRTRPTMAGKGKVRLASGLQVDSGAVFIRGTSRGARIGADGAYDLGLIPVDAGDMAVGLVYKASVREARIAEQIKAVPADTGKPGPGISVRDTAKPIYRCREVTVDSAAKLGTPPSDIGRTGTVTAFQTADTARLDTAKVAAVERSCDSLATGTVIAVRSAPAGGAHMMIRDSVTTDLIVVNDAGTSRTGAPISFGTGPGSAVLVPLGRCVAAPGTSQTTYSVSFSPTASGQDLLVGDVDGKCLR